jgi:hypothetical protein
MSDYTEGCCFNYFRDNCSGRGCICKCHEEEAERLRQRSRDEDTARIRLNDARIKAEAERDAARAWSARWKEALEHADEVARLTTWGITVADCREACEHPACLILRAISRYRKTRAALAEAGGEGQRAGDNDRG